MNVEKYDPSRLSGRLVDVWPYAEAFFPPETFPEMWAWMKEDNTLHQTFYEGGVTTLPNLVRFFDQMIFPNRLLLLYTTKQGEGAGFGWFDQVIPKVRAFANICMRRRFWGAHTDEACRISIDYIFGAHGVASVFGFTPNKMAHALMKRLGAKDVAMIPGLASYNGTPADVLVTRLAKGDWNGRRG
jgi:RimJ/RimL family protein N-acetyltransferase